MKFGIPEILLGVGIAAIIGGVVLAVKIAKENAKDLYRAEEIREWYKTYII